MANPIEPVTYNGISYSPITFEEFASHTKYSLFGVPRYRWTNKPVIILATFSTRTLTFTRKDFARFDRTMGSFAYLKPPSGGEAGPAISLSEDFDDAAWGKCKTLWQSYSATTPGVSEQIPRFFFLGTILFDKKVFRSHYLALDTILFANSHAAEPKLPAPSDLYEMKAEEKTPETGDTISIKKVDPVSDPGL